MGNPIVFIILAAIALASALGMLLGRNAVHSALFLVLNFSTIAVLFLVLTIYAGAIMVLFLFVVMLLGAERLKGRGDEVGSWQVPLSIVLAAILLVTFGYVIITGADSSGATAEALIDASPQAIGLTLFETYLFPFEVASVLLLVAMVGVVVLRTKRGKDG